MRQIWDLIRQWGFRFLKDYEDLHQRVLVLEQHFDMQMQINKGFAAEIEELKKR